MAVGRQLSPALVLALCLSCAWCLRLWGSAHGFPDFVTGDERAVIKDAVRFLDRGTIEPGHYNYPAGYSYVFSAALLIAYGCGYLLDGGSAGWSVVFAHLMAPAQIAFVGRVLSIVAGTALVALVYQLGTRAYGNLAALGGALAAVFSTLLVHHSRFALPAMLMAALALASCIFAIDIARKGDRGSYLKAGLLLGLAATVKYNAGMLALGLIVAHCLSSQRKHAYLGLAGLVSLAAFALGSPYWLVEPSRYLAGLSAVSSNLQFSLGPSEWPRLVLLWEFIRTESPWALLGLAGVFYAAWQRQAADLVLLAIIVPAFFYIGSWPKGGLHYVIYLIPLTGLLGARVLVALMRTEQVRWVLLVYVVLSLPLLWQHIGEAKQLSREDLRTTAARWIEAHIADGTVLGIYRIDYCPPLKGDIHRNFLRQRLAANDGGPQLQNRLQQLERAMPIYTQLTLEYFMPAPQVPEAYLSSIDISDPKTVETFRRTWMQYEELKHWQVAYLVLPNAGYGRFFVGATPPIGTPAHYYFTRSRSYLSQFFNPQDKRYRTVKEFIDGDSKITIVQVL